MDAQSIQILGDMDLAAQSAGRPDLDKIGECVEHLGLISDRRSDTIAPAVINIDMAGRALTNAAAQRVDPINKITDGEVHDRHPLKIGAGAFTAVWLDIGDARHQFAPFACAGHPAAPASALPSAGARAATVRRL